MKYIHFATRTSRSLHQCIRHLQRVTTLVWWQRIVVTYNHSIENYNIYVSITTIY